MLSSGQPSLDVGHAAEFLDGITVCQNQCRCLHDAVLVSKLRMFVSIDGRVADACAVEQGACDLTVRAGRGLEEEHVICAGGCIYISPCVEELLEIPW